MREMTAHIRSLSCTTTLGEVLRAEITLNKQEVANNPEWNEKDRKMVVWAMNAEAKTIATHLDLHGEKDSVKGESAMKIAYPSYRGKATDAITLRNDGKIVLAEAKYLIKFGGCGPFGGPSSFKNRVADKFKDMAMVMAPDGESIETLRIIVVTEAQLHVSMSHIHKLRNANYPAGAFSGDGRRHAYVLCSSASIRTLVDNGINSQTRTFPDCLFFNL